MFGLLTSAFLHLRDIRESSKYKKSTEGKVSRTWIYPLHAIGIEELRGIGRAGGYTQPTSVL